MDLYVEESIHVTTIFKNIQNYELKNLLLHSIYNLIFNSFGKSNIFIHSRTLSNIFKTTLKGKMYILEPSQTVLNSIELLLN